MLRTAVAGASQAQTEELVRQVFRDVHQKNVQLKPCARRLSMITMVSEMHPAVVG